VSLKTGQPVIVTWLDPHLDTDATGEANDFDPVDDSTATTSTIGFWVKEEDGIILLANDWYPKSKKRTKEFRGIFRVQRVLVTRVKRLT
jgi:hypothetical protein